MEKILVVLAVVVVACILWFGAEKFRQVEKERDDAVAALVKANDTIVSLSNQRLLLALFAVGSNIGWAAYVYLGRNRRKITPRQQPTSPDSSCGM